MPNNKLKNNKMAAQSFYGLISISGEDLRKNIMQFIEKYNNHHISELLRIIIIQYTKIEDINEIFKWFKKYYSTDRKIICEFINFYDSIVCDFIYHKNLLEFLEINDENIMNIDVVIDENEYEDKEEDKEEDKLDLIDIIKKISNKKSNKKEKDKYILFYKNLKQKIKIIKYIGYKKFDENDIIYKKYNCYYRIFNKIVLQINNDNHIENTILEYLKNGKCNFNKFVDDKIIYYKKEKINIEKQKKENYYNIFYERVRNLFKDINEEKLFQIDADIGNHILDKNINITMEDFISKTLNINKITNNKIIFNNIEKSISSYFNNIVNQEEENGKIDDISFYFDRNDNIEFLNDEKIFKTISNLYRSRSWIDKDIKQTYILNTNNIEQILKFDNFCKNINSVNINNEEWFPVNNNFFLLESIIKKKQKDNEIISFEINGSIYLEVKMCFNIINYNGYVFQNNINLERAYFDDKNKYINEISIYNYKNNKLTEETISFGKLYLQKLIPNYSFDDIFSFDVKKGITNKQFSEYLYSIILFVEDKESIFYKRLKNNYYIASKLLSLTPLEKLGLNNCIEKEEEEELYKIINNKINNNVNIFIENILKRIFNLPYEKKIYNAEEEKEYNIQKKFNDIYYDKYKHVMDMINVVLYKDKNNTNTCFSLYEIIIDKKHIDILDKKFINRINDIFNYSVIYELKLKKKEYKNPILQIIKDNIISMTKDNEEEGELIKEINSYLYNKPKEEFINELKEDDKFINELEEDKKEEDDDELEDDKFIINELEEDDDELEEEEDDDELDDDKEFINTYVKNDEDEEYESDEEYDGKKNYVVCEFCKEKQLHNHFVDTIFFDKKKNFDIIKNMCFDCLYKD